MSTTTTQPGNPLSNAEIAARWPKSRDEIGQRTQVSQMLILKRSHQLVWCGRLGEIRDSRSTVIFSGSLSEAKIEAARLGLI